MYDMKLSFTLLIICVKRLQLFDFSLFHFCLGVLLHWSTIENMTKQSREGFEVVLVA